jgi:hypothetical protein
VRLGRLKSPASSLRRALRAAAALGGACVILPSAGDAAVARAPDHSPRGNGVGAPIAWRPCDARGPRLQCAAIRVPLDWDRPNGRTIRLAVIRHLASKPAERIGTLFINPGGPGDSGVHLVSGDPEGVDALGGGRFDGVSWDPRGTNRQHRGALLQEQTKRSEVLGGRVDPHHDRPSTALRAPGRRRGATLRQDQRLAPAPYLDRRHRPRPRPRARPDGREEAHLRRPLLRLLHRRDLRQHVSTGSGRSCSTASSIRSGTRRAPRRGGPCGATPPTRCFAGSCRCAKPREPSVARSRAARRPRPNGGDGWWRG